MRTDSNWLRSAFLRASKSLVCSDSSLLTWSVIEPTLKNLIIPNTNSSSSVQFNLGSPMLEAKRNSEHSCSRGATTCRRSRISLVHCCLSWKRAFVQSHRITATAVLSNPLSSQDSWTCDPKCWRRLTKFWVDKHQNNELNLLRFGQCVRRSEHVVL